MPRSILPTLIALTTLLSTLTLTLATPIPPTILPRDANKTTTTLTFSLTAAHSGLDGQNVHLLPLNANGGNFWVGGPLGEKDTATYCPLVNKTLCPAGVTTEFLGRVGVGGISMNTEVPGGQALYVNSSGALSFTTAHSAYTPPGSNFGPFNITLSNYPTGPAQLQYAGPGAKETGAGFLGCSAKGREHGPYQVFVDRLGLRDEDVLGGCVRECIAFGAIFFVGKGGGGPAAWQYT